MAVSQDAILAAADQLAADGKNPTMAAIREICGGSYSTIGPILREWKSHRTAATQPASDPPPDEIVERLNALGSEIWQRASAIADERLTTERQALDQVRQELAEASQEATEIADHLTQENDELKARLATANSNLKERQDENKQLTADLAAARATVTQLREHISSVERRYDQLMAKVEPPAKPTRTRRRNSDEA